MIFSCSSRFPGAIEPLVYSQPDGSESVFLFDGNGSWGSGVEAAGWFREQLADLIHEPDGITPTSIEGTLNELLEILPEHFVNDAFGWQFSLAIVVVEQSTVHVAATGSFAALALCGNVVQRLVAPMRLVEGLVSKGIISKAKAETNHRYRRLITAHQFGTNGAQLKWCGPTIMESGDRIVLGDAELPHLLESQKIAFDTLDVIQLRDEIEKCGGCSSPTALIAGFR